MLYELTDIIRQFGSRTVLDLPHLAFKAQKIYALIGPNGAGKTTLLNQFAFLDQPSSGTLRFRNQPVDYSRNNLTRLRRQVVLVDQTPILFSGTVGKNIEFGLRVRGVCKKERRVKIQGALERVGMSDFVHEDVYGLSGGEVKRVALARALALEPEVLLCDEPTANVDQQHQEIILKILEHTNSVGNTTVIFSTHYLSQSRRLAHQTILLQNGRLSHGVGENNFVVELVPQGNKSPAVVLIGEHRQSIEMSAHLAGLEDGGVVHLIPSKMSLQAFQKVDDKLDGLSGRIVSVNAENDMVRVIVDVGVMLQVVLKSRAYREKPYWVGQRVGVGIDERAVQAIK